MPARHPQTGRLISTADAQRIAERLPMAHPRPDSDDGAVAVLDRPAETAPFTPVRVWTAGPGMVREKIHIPGKAGGLRPVADGSYHLTSQIEYDAARRALGPRFWPDTVPEGEPSPRCETCKWSARSYAAVMHHINHAHGKPQGS